MADFGWTTMLRAWSDAVIRSQDGDALPADVQQARWLGTATATEEQIAAAEGRLKIALPPSYRAFLKVSNGWGRTSSAIERVWGTEEIGWFRKSNADWIRAYAVPRAYGTRHEIPDAEYFAYGIGAGGDFRVAHLKETLQVSAVGDGVYLLNPQVIAKDGEWEAWFFATWIPGAHRYRSFREMMEAEYHRYIGQDWKPLSPVPGELPDEYLGSPSSAKRRAKKRTKPREPKVLGKRLSQWTVDELLKIGRAADMQAVWVEVVEGLSGVGDARAIDELVRMVRDDADAGITAVGGLARLAPERLPELLLRVAAERRFMGFQTAVHMLVERGEERVVPILVDVIGEDSGPSGLGEYSGGYLASLGRRGFEVLVELAQDSRPHVRRRAVRGLMYVTQSEVRELLEGLANDADLEVRETAQFALKALPPKRRA